MPAPLAVASPLQLRHRLHNPALQPAKLLTDSPATSQKPSQWHDHTAGRCFVGQHYEPRLRGITGHSASPHSTAQLKVIRFTLSYPLDPHPSCRVRPIVPP